MKITNIETIRLKIPFVDHGEGKGLTPGTWNQLDFALIKIDTDAGITGWGEAFGYFCSTAVEAVINELIRPILIGQDATNPAAINELLQRRLSLFGRYGITLFAVSGIDIALWDIKAKAAGKPLHQLLGESVRKSLAAYASLVRYGEGPLAAEISQKALAEGFRHIKLHEITLPEIESCRAAVGGEIPLMIDVNNNWTVEQCRDLIPALKALDVSWLEEPIFPPEDWQALAKLREQGLAITAGENACTAMQFEHMMQAGAVDYPQPSVTKVGGISEFIKVAELARRHGLTLMPHSPYFGPGYLATLQLAAVIPHVGLFEYLYVEPEQFLYPGMPFIQNGQVSVPEGVGLGFDPDPDVLARYRVN